MNRSIYFNYIEEKLNSLSTSIQSRGKLNILDLHLHSENFYLHFFNELYGWNLYNLNKKIQNVEAIDLVDDPNKLLIQVSATSTKQKIESTLKKDIIKKYNSYTFKFISISKDADNLRKMKFANPYNITFNPIKDIYDTTSILSDILSLNIDIQKRIYNFIKKELGGELDIVKLDSNLATIIDILSKEDWNIHDPIESINSYEIDRKIKFNNLDVVKDIIDDYKIHHSRVDKKYTEFDKMGKNKSNSVLGTIRNEYIKAKKTLSDDDLFFYVLEKIKEKVIHSANYKLLPVDELDICINILAVDAFIRCKIFENPEDYNYAATR
jgi:hypothetical protein